MKKQTGHDDNDGDPYSGILTVGATLSGDMWINVIGGPLRYRAPIFGGGKYPKIRNALLLLVDAIRQEGKVG